MSPTTSVALIATCGTTHPNAELEVFMLPDLVSDYYYPLRPNPRRYSVLRVTERWPLAGSRLVEPRITQFMGLYASGLAAARYPDAVRPRVCSDYLNWLFTMDDWLEESDIIYWECTNASFLRSVIPLTFRQKHLT